MTIIKSVWAWLILLGVAIANGSFRAYYAGHLGADRANQVSCGTGIALIAAAVWILSRYWPFRSASSAWRTGLLWLLMTVAWEFLFFHYVAGRSWEELLGNYAFWDGRLWVAVLAAILVLPAIVHAAGQSKAAFAPALLWGLAAWAACGLVLTVSRVLWGIQIALWVHVAAAPVISFAATFLYWNHPRHLPPLPTAVLLIGAVFCLDLLVVAPFFERSFAMFESILGTWLPMGLMAVTSYLAGLLLSLPWGSRPFFRWMPHPRELHAAMPGDDLLDTEDGATHAITIEAAPARVWPWLVQMGYGRAGWYSHDRLDNWGHRSADRIRPELQSLNRGDLLPSTPGGKCFFEVLEIEHERSLVLGSHLAVGPLRSLLWRDPSPPIHQRSTWSFALAPSEPGTTRLLVRGRGVSVPVWRWLPIDAFFSVAHIIMQRKQLLTLKQRAEAFH